MSRGRMAMVGGALVLVAAAAGLVTRHAPAVTSSGPQSSAPQSAATRGAEGGPGPASNGAALPGSNVAQPEGKRLSIGGAGAAAQKAPPHAAATNAVVLRPSQVVVRVNGSAIAGKDVVGFAGKQTEESISAQTYATLVGRAVERELTLQEAKKRGVTLSSSQKAQLAEVRKQAAARGSTKQPGEPDPDEIALEERDAEAQLLLTELLAKGGTPPPGPTDQDVEAYYKAHAQTFGSLPSDPTARAAALAKIDPEIRQRLLAEQQQSWSAKRQELLHQLRAKANISY